MSIRPGRSLDTLAVVRTGKSQTKSKRVECVLIKKQGEFFVRYEIHFGTDKSPLGNHFKEEYNLN